MVGRRLREHKLQARTLQLKLRYSDFTTITRAHSMPRATDLDTEIFEESPRAVPAELEARRHGPPPGRARGGLGRRTASRWIYYWESPQYQHRAAATGSIRAWARVDDLSGGAWTMARSMGCSLV